MIFDYFGLREGIARITPRPSLTLIQATWSSFLGLQDLKD